MSKKKTQQQNSTTGFYGRLPKAVALDERYNDTDKYVFAALLSLANNVKNKGFHLFTTKLAKMLSISVRVLQYTVTRLATTVKLSNDFKQRPLVYLSYDAKKRRRVITLDNVDADAYVLIPHDVMKDASLSIPTKMFYGRAFVTRPGFVYERILDIADYTDYHKSSVYRHIHELTNAGYLKRDISADGYKFIAKDSYSESLQLKQKKTKDKVYYTGERANDKLSRAPPTKPVQHDPKADAAIHELYQRIK